MIKISDILKSIFSMLKDYEMVQRVGSSTISPQMKAVNVRLALATQRVSRFSSENLDDITNCEKPLSRTFGPTEIESNFRCRAITSQCVCVADRGCG